MKKFILCGLFLSPLLVLADDPAPTPATNAPGTAPATTAAQPTEKAAALAIRDSLVAIFQGGDASQATWDAVDAKISGYQKDYGVTTATTNNVILLRKMELSVAQKKADPAVYQALLQKLSTDPMPQVAAVATQKLAVLKQTDDLKTKPMDLKFTAVDGTPIDLANLRGKVVLIDFWATWCPPCREEVPNVVAAYQKYHDQGFEVIGISLDQNKDALLDFTKKNGMVWPQYFDGKGWSNEVSSSFGINSIPAMWLLDKKGVLVTTDGREDLAGQVEKLLK